jgi:hypothetical protein
MSGASDAQRPVLPPWWPQHRPTDARGAPAHREGPHGAWWPRLKATGGRPPRSIATAWRCAAGPTARLYCRVPVMASLTLLEVRAANGGMSYPTDGEQEQRAA